MENDQREMINGERALFSEGLFRSPHSFLARPAAAAVGLSVIHSQENAPMAFGTLSSAPHRNRRLIALVAVCLLGLFSSDLLAAGKPGIVTTKRDDKYLGDIDTTSVAGSVVITDSGGHHIQLNLLNVQNIKYFANNR